ncbi:MAG: YCF48-related protein [Bacteroidota bacterium]
MAYKILCALCTSAFIFSANAQYRVEVLDSASFQLGEGVVLSKTSFRGLSVVNDQTIWVSGSRGTIARSVDGGKSFGYKQLKGYEKSDFRDIEAFDDKRAIIMSSGTPAYILKTTNGGDTWKEVYKNMDTAYFLDAMDFWDEKRGMLVGDPIKGHFILLQTKDGGETWKELDTILTPKAFDGEAVFAASGTSLRCWGRNEFGFVTGGVISRLWRSDFKCSYSKSDTLEMIQGKQSQGTFSFYKMDKSWMFVGGDYMNDTQITKANVYYAFKNVDNAHNWGENIHGYKSAVELINIGFYGHPHFIATGTSGTEIGKYLCGFLNCSYHWDKVSSESFHVVRKAKNGNAIFLAGPKGKIGRLVR